MFSLNSAGIWKFVSRMITLCSASKRLDLSFAGNFELTFPFNLYPLMIMRYSHSCLPSRNLFYFDTYSSIKPVIILNDLCLIFVLHSCHSRVLIFATLIPLNSFIPYCSILLLYLNSNHVGTTGAMPFYLANLIEHN